MSERLDRVLETHRMVVEEAFREPKRLRYRSYALSTLRGGVGKSTLAFNLAYELAQVRPLLMADLCPQCNLTETLLVDAAPAVNIIHALQPELLGPAFGNAPEDVTYRASRYCEAFKRAKPCWVIPGSSEMFAFGSMLCQQLQIANAQARPPAIASLLTSLRKVLDAQADDVDAAGVLMDTSPFYAGATHLAWRAADAIIIPVRVDEHSLASLELTLDLLTNPAKNFQVWNARAGGLPTHGSPRS